MPSKVLKMIAVDSAAIVKQTFHRDRVGSVAPQCHTVQVVRQEINSEQVAIDWSECLY